MMCAAVSHELRLQYFAIALLGSVIWGLPSVVRALIAGMIEIFAAVPASGLVAAASELNLLRAGVIAR